MLLDDIKTSAILSQIPLFQFYNIININNDIPLENDNAAIKRLGDNMYTSTKSNVNFLFCYLFGLLYCNIYQRDEYKVYLV